MEIQATNKVSDVQIPSKLIFHILSFLSNKSLIRFMCVSKSWHSLISSPKFIKNHLKTSSKTKGTAHRRLIFSSFVHIDNIDFRECDLNSALYSPMTEATGRLEYPVYKFTNQAINNYPLRKPGKYFEVYGWRSGKVLGSCNGLVCISTPNRHLLLLNPSIRKYKILPDIGPDFKHSNPSGHYCVPSYGFGYEELHDDYKVVAILWCGLSAVDRDEKIVMVYSLRTNSWERNEASKNCPVLKDWYVVNNRGGTLLNGKLHWTANLAPHYDRSENKIVSFDLSNETFGGVDLPENVGQPKYPGDSFHRWSIGVLGEGCLALVCDQSPEQVDLDVWIMMEYGVIQSWTKVASVRYVEYRQYECQFHVLVQPVFSSNKGEILLKLGSKLVLYNPEDKSRRELRISIVPNESSYLKVDMYDESLVLLDATDAQNS